MKQIKTEWLLLVLALLFLSFCAGHWLGSRSSQEGLRVITERTADTQPASESAQSNTERTSDNTAQTDAPADTRGTTAATTGSEKLNLNTATLAELKTLPGIGDVLAQRIIDYRDAHGGFASVEELDAVEGIGAKRLDAIRDYITVEELP